MNDEAALDRMFQALADSSRRRMIDRLSQGPASVKELAAPLSMALPTVLKHLAVLESGGIVSSSKTGRVRTFRITPDAIAKLEAWTAQRKATLDRQFDQLEQLLAKLPKEKDAPT
jgi:DNA-binding transcriptional ArsR family regulator